MSTESLWKQSSQKQPAFSISWWLLRVPRYLCVLWAVYGIYLSVTYLAAMQIPAAGAALIVGIVPYLSLRRLTPGQSTLPHL
jgi:hypothetical protein